MKTGSGGTWRVAAVGLLVVLATFAVYSPSIGYDFIRLDDDKYIFENPMVSGGFTWAGLKSAWTESTESYWAPLLWMSFMADVELFGLEPWGFHLVNVALFSLNAGLLFALARRWTGRTGMGLAVAMLWAMHPARVESVAWVVERKDVLSGLFILLGIGAYCEGKRGNLRHGTILAWLFMALGGTVKQIVVVMPAMLVLLDVWPLGRTTWSRIWRDGWRLAAEKWAFWALALGLAMLPIWFHHQDGRLLPIPMTHRLAMIPIHYLFYLEKLVWPSGLAVLQGDLAFGWGAFACGVGILAGATWGLWLAREKAPWALAGWAWFVGTLFPLSGVVWGGAERLATRFLYVPQIGLTLAAALAAGETMRLRNWGRGWGMAVCALTVAAWAGLTLRLLPHWRNSQTIFARVLSVNPNSVHAFDNFGRACFFEGKLLEWDRFLDGYRKKHPANPLAEIHAAWWQAAMAGQAEEGVRILEKLTGRDPARPEFWTWLDDKTESENLAGTWRDTAAICLRMRKDVGLLETLREHWEGKWDDRKRGNFLAESLIAHWVAGRDEKAEEIAGELNAICGGEGDARERTFGRIVSRWQQGARGYAFISFREYAGKFPEDWVALNNMAWLAATAVPDGIGHARMEEWPAAAAEWAERSAELSGGQVPEVLNTLAAARANAGDFGGAVAASERALALAAESGNGALEAAIRKRLEGYRSGKPWRE